MEMPKIWENIINTVGGLPVVIYSIQKVVDGQMHIEGDSMHEHFEFVYVENAKNARFEVCGETVNVKTNDILLIKPNTPHYLKVEGSEANHFYVLKFCFVKDHKSTLANVSIEDFLNFVSGSEDGAYIRLPSRYRGPILNALQSITYEGKKNDENSEFLCSLLTMEIFVWLSRALKVEWEISINKKGDKMMEVMEAAKRFIEDNYTQDIELGDIAKFVFLSASHFARAFKKTYGISPIQHMLTLRIQKAKELLETTDMKIGDIAFGVGFSAQQRFNDIFRKQTGCSPTEYRVNFRKSILNT